MNGQPQLTTWSNGALGFVLSILVMEMLLHGIEESPAWRILPVVERELGWPDPETGYALRPDHEIINVRENRSRVSTNASGMRDKDRLLIKPANTYRVAITGDSFTEALQVNDQQTFTRLAETALNVATNTINYEILNFGMSGAGPVQQYVQLRRTVVAFSPDAIVMLIDANQFHTRELFDDSMNPAYVEDSNGGLELGFAFRQRRSQRYRDSTAGEIFFKLMDNSRVARAVYLRYRHGAQMAAATAVSSSKATQQCSSTNARIKRHLEFWQARKPSPAVARLERFLADVAEIKSGAGIPLVLVLYGLGDAQNDCVDAALAREAMVSAIEQRLSTHGLQLLDAGGDLRNRLPHGDRLVELHGFGAQVGVGHLNNAGHRAYSALLTDLITTLSTAQKGSDRE